MPFSQMSAARCDRAAFLAVFQSLANDSAGPGYRNGVAWSGKDNRRCCLTVVLGNMDLDQCPRAGIERAASVWIVVGIRESNTWHAGAAGGPIDADGRVPGVAQNLIADPLILLIRVQHRAAARTIGVKGWITDPELWCGQHGQ